MGWLYAENVNHLMAYVTGLAAILSVLTVILRIPRLPYAPIGLLGFVWYLLAADMAGMTYYEVGDTIAASATGLAQLALICQIPSLVAARWRRPFAYCRWLVWWVKPLLYTSGFLAVSSLSLMLVVHAYPTSAHWAILNAVLLGLNVAAIFSKTKQRGWAWIALGLAWVGWFQLLDVVGLTGLQWHTIPLGIVLLGLARTVRQFPPQATEFLAITVLMFGGALDLYAQGLWSLATALFLLQLAALALYGFQARRVVPFASAVSAVVGGVMLALAAINLWLLPLGAGVLLLTGAVLIEVAHPCLVQWVVFWRDRFEVPTAVHLPPNTTEFRAVQPDQRKSSP